MSKHADRTRPVDERPSVRVGKWDWIARSDGIRTSPRMEELGTVRAGFGLQRPAHGGDLTVSPLDPGDLVEYLVRELDREPEPWASLRRFIIEGGVAS